MDKQLFLTSEYSPDKQTVNIDSDKLLIDATASIFILKNKLANANVFIESVIKQNDQLQTHNQVLLQLANDLENKLNEANQHIATLKNNKKKNKEEKSRKPTTIDNELRAPNTVKFSPISSPSLRDDETLIHIQITDGWEPDTKEKRQTDWMIFGSIRAIDKPIDKLEVGMIVALRTRSGDFTNGELPDIQPSQTATLRVKTSIAQLATPKNLNGIGKEKGAYFTLVPAMGISARPAPAVLVALDGGAK